MSDSDVLDVSSNEESIYDIVKRLAREALESRKPQKLSGAEIKAYIERSHPTEYDKIKSSLSPYLTRASQDATSWIVREPGAYGYILSKPRIEASVSAGESFQGASVEAVPEAATPQTPRELKLYHLLQEWLVAHDYKSEDVARYRSGGAWGNPDVVGLRLEECLHDHIEIELVTIEAKLSLTNWKQFIFEAVAHKRFADRAYFAFAVKLDDADVFRIGEYKELRKYGEKYGLGVLAICIPDDVYGQLSDPTASSVALSDVRVVEIWPAIADKPDTVEKDRFIKSVLKMSSKASLFNFGT
jgi:hypothetical protein